MILANLEVIFTMVISIKRRVRRGDTCEGQESPGILVLHIIYSPIFHVGTFSIYFSTNNKGKKYFRKYITKDGYNKTFC